MFLLGLAMQSYLSSRQNYTSFTYLLYRIAAFIIFNLLRINIIFHDNMYHYCSCKDCLLFGLLWGFLQWAFQNYKIIYHPDSLAVIVGSPVYS